MREDLVKRLREYARGVAYCDLSEEAADEIERLRLALQFARSDLAAAIKQIDMEIDANER